MTKSFPLLQGIHEGQGFLRIEGEAEFPIQERGIGSLAIVYFKSTGSGFSDLFNRPQ